MLLYFLVILSITFSDAVRGTSRKSGKYSDIILSQRSIVATYYELRKEWPTIDTTSDNCELTEKACQALSKPSRWILRGLWPHKRSGSSPQSCVKLTKGYVMSFINSTLKESLALQWPNLLTGEDHDHLWEVVWHRHGSCLTDIDGMQTVEEYFIKALEMLNEYNIGSFLEKNDIFPGGSYSLDHIYDLIQSEYNVKPRIKCVTVQEPEQEPVQYLLEVALYFNKSLEFIDCYLNGYSCCDDTKQVTYATILGV